MFSVTQTKLPHDGVIPGARGHKKQIISTGTAVWVIKHGRLFYWAVYLTEYQAQKCAHGLAAYVNGLTRRKIELHTLLAFNFKYDFPKRVVRL
jgi:hypothetical protein